MIQLSSDLMFDQTNPSLFIGMLSGTSMDSIDAILVEFIGKHPQYYKIINKISCAFKATIVRNLRNIIAKQGSTNLAAIGAIDHQLGIEFAKVVNKLLVKAKISPDQVVAIGSHGQNIWHVPMKKNSCSIQLGDPNLIATYTKIPTITDFRRKDLALGGQGAPLAPGLHAALFRSTVVTRAIVNIGGISNVTILPKDPKQVIVGFDLGPGNCLMDEWVQLKFANLNLMYDRHGDLAAQGKLIPELLTLCLKDQYFNKLAPKATGREYFNQVWWNKYIAAAKRLSGRRSYSNLDLLTTLLHLTVRGISQQLLRLPYPKTSLPIEEVYICGGGAKNRQLLKLLVDALPWPVKTTTVLGVDPVWVEAVLFAWLAKQTVSGLAGNIPTVTGARRAGILGGIYLP